MGAAIEILSGGIVRALLTRTMHLESSKNIKNSERRNIFSEGMLWGKKKSVFAAPSPLGRPATRLVVQQASLAPFFYPPLTSSPTKNVRSLWVLDLF